MADVFTPETIVDQPIPALDTSIVDPSLLSLGQSNASSTESQSGVTTTSIMDQPIPKTTIAAEVISVSLDTLQKRILGSFSFGKVGALQVGTYKASVSGQVSISPSGITALNASNQTTFSIDGTTGNASFMGSLTAGSIITGAIDVGNGNVIIDGGNDRIIINDGVTNRIVIGNI